MIDVEVAYAEMDEQKIIAVRVEETATLEQAVRQSGILQQFGGIDLNRNKVGIFGKVCSLGQLLKPGDRVEIYRPLLLSPMAARRLRASRSQD